MIDVNNTQIFVNTSPADRGRARAVFLDLAKQKKPRRRKIKAVIRRQLDYLQQNLEAIDTLVASGEVLSSLKTHWWHKLLVISELHRQQTILLYAKTRSIPDRIVNLVQRQVRPMVRGKARATVEFGALARRASARSQSVFP
jgi:IS5 family transposase